MAHPYRMLVEGEDDKHVIIELMGHHTKWPQNRKDAPVWLEACNGYGAIVEGEFISTKLYETGTKTLGIVLDADVDFSTRWNCLRNIARRLFTKVPVDMPPDGLILQDDADGPRLGLWIMPDNKQHGMLETLLKEMASQSLSALLTFATDCVKKARNHGAPYKDAHADKAEVHSWLSWQDPPGQALGRAITSLTLDPKAACAKPFVEWFLRLYNLDRS